MTPPVSVKPNRTPWVIAGVLGGLLVCILIAAVGIAGVYLVNRPDAPVGKIGLSPTPVGLRNAPSTPLAVLLTATPLPSIATPGKTAVTSSSSTPIIGPPVGTAVTSAGVLPAAAPRTIPVQVANAPAALVLAVTTPTSSPYEIVGVPTAPADQPIEEANTPSPYDIIGVPTAGPVPPANTPDAPPVAVPPTAVPPTPRPPTAAPAKHLIAFSRDDGQQPEAKSLWIMNSDGTGVVKLTARASHPILSADGNQIAFYHWTDGIFLVNATNTKNVVIKKIVGDTFSGGNYGSGDWSHNGRWIAFTRQPGGRGNIVVDVVAPDGTGQRTVAIGESPSWSPDDTMLAFHTCRNNTCGIYKGSINGGDAIPIVGDDGGLPDWSPDGKRIVYQKEVDGQKQLFLINPDGSGKKQLTSGAAMHVDAAWSPDGAYIYYRATEGGSWGIYRMNADGTNPIKLLDNVPPVNWPYERLSVSR